ncbi:MAG: hypothetical protein LBT40_11805 [Deltaproteobacteria bacterium]|jgi:hypothetical protein|nr:hypothetical protein [Deltaproteobacteria bacterium]
MKMSTHGQGWRLAAVALAATVLAASWNCRAEAQTASDSGYADAGTGPVIDWAEHVYAGAAGRARGGHAAKGRCRVERDRSSHFRCGGGPSRERWVKICDEPSRKKRDRSPFERSLRHSASGTASDVADAVLVLDGDVQFVPACMRTRKRKDSRYDRRKSRGTKPESKGTSRPGRGLTDESRGS